MSEENNNEEKQYLDKLEDLESEVKETKDIVKSLRGYNRRKTFFWLLKIIILIFVALVLWYTFSSFFDGVISFVKNIFL